MDNDTQHQPTVGTELPDPPEPAIGTRSDGKVIVLDEDYARVMLDSMNGKPSTTTAPPNSTPNLLQLVTNHPNFTTIPEFAYYVGVSRATVYRWATTMPSPWILHTIADTLGEHDAVVLAAALRSAGYITTLNDMLEGIPIHVVTHGFTRTEQWPKPVAAYPDEDVATSLVNDLELVSDGYYDATPVTITAAAPRLPVRYFAGLNQAALSTSTDPAASIVSHSGPAASHLFPDPDYEPANTFHGAQSPLIVHTTNGYVMRIETRAFDRTIARTIVARAAHLLRDHFPPPGTDFTTVTDLPPNTNELPAGVHHHNPDTPHPALVIELDQLLTPDEIATAEHAYRTARDINTTATQTITAFNQVADYPPDNLDDPDAD